MVIPKPLGEINLQRIASGVVDVADNPVVSHLLTVPKELAAYSLYVRVELIAD